MLGAAVLVGRGDLHQLGALGAQDVERRQVGLVGRGHEAEAHAVERGHVEPGGVVGPSYSAPASVAGLGVEAVGHAREQRGPRRTRWRVIGPAVSWEAEIGMIPVRLISPTVGFTPTREFALAG